MISKLSIVALALSAAGCTSIGRSKSIAEATHRGQLKMAAGVMTKDEFRVALAEKKALGLPEHGTWNEAAVQKDTKEAIKIVGPTICAANIAYNNGRITEAERLMIVAQVEGNQAAQHAVNPDALSSASNRLQNFSQQMNNINQQSWNNYNALRSKSVTLTPTSTGGYTGTIR